MSNNSQGHSVKAVGIVNRGCVSHEGRINKRNGVCRRRVNGEKSIGNDNDNEATVVGTHLIKNKTIYQLNEKNDLLKTDIDLNPILEDEKSIRNDNNNEATIVGTHAVKNKTIYQLNNSEFVSVHKKDKNVTTDTKAQSTPEILKLNDIKPKSNKTRNCKHDKRKVSTKNKSNLFESPTKDSLGIT